MTIYTSLTGNALCEYGSHITSRDGHTPPKVSFSVPAEVDDSGRGDDTAEVQVRRTGKNANGDLMLSTLQSLYDPNLRSV